MRVQVPPRVLYFKGFKPFYYKLRPNIAIKKEEILTVEKNTGLHFSLEGLARLYEKGELKIIQNLGYPQPVLSHFRSIDIWETGGDGKSQSRNGWLVKSLEDYAQKTSIDAKAIFLDNSYSIFRGGHDGYLGPNALGIEPQEIEMKSGMIMLNLT